MRCCSSSWAAVGSAIGDEARAYNNLGDDFAHAHKTGGFSSGLALWLPNLNIYRDPRWGRNVEVPSEDPYHSGEFGAELVRGVQGFYDPHEKSGGFVKIAASVKHLTAYSMETGRMSNNFNISAQDMNETYLPAFEGAIAKGGAYGYMCSYSAVNNVPSCANPEFATIARSQWGLKGFIVSDCQALRNMGGDQVYCKNKTNRACNFGLNNTDIATKVIESGACTIECDRVLQGSLHQVAAQRPDLVRNINASTRYTISMLVDLGVLAPLADQPYTALPATTIGSAHNKQVSLESARQGIVLLRNQNRVLPLKRGKKIALIGPHGRTRKSLCGAYWYCLCPGQCDVFGKSNSVSDGCVPSIEQALTTHDPTATVTYFQGVDMTPECAWDSAGAGGLADGVLQAEKPGGCGNGNLTNAVAGVSDADIVILALGNDEWSNGFTAHENKDRVNIGLPGQQQPLADAILAAAKKVQIPVVAVLVNGGLCSLDSFAIPDSGVHGILEALEPGNTGGTAVAEALFGDTNSFGKLPFTMYPRNFTTISDMHDMSMATYPGRTYKYYHGPSALFDFGFGLSYTEFEISEPSTLLRQEMDSAKGWLTTSVRVTNVGTVAGDEVVFLFRKPNQTDTDGARQVPQKQLIGFERVTLAPGQGVTVQFNVTAGMLSTYIGHSNVPMWEVRPGKHHLAFSRGHGREIARHIHVP